MSFGAISKDVISDFSTHNLRLPFFASSQNSEKANARKTGEDDLYRALCIPFVCTSVNFPSSKSCKLYFRIKLLTL